jgi:5-formaminoimidazole-4-carboxamide-1-beta-D-ribofuranosyl 5'-monophosphate synthetase
MGHWTNAQVNEFAKRFANANKATWPAYVDDVRDAMIGNFVLEVVLSQDRVDVSVVAVRSLLGKIAARLSRKHHMSSSLGEHAIDLESRVAHEDVLAVIRASGVSPEMWPVGPEGEES